MADDLLVMTLTGYPDRWRVNELSKSKRRLAILIWAGSAHTFEVLALEGFQGDAAVVLAGYPDGLAVDALTQVGDSVRHVYVTGSGIPNWSRRSVGWVDFDTLSIGAGWPDSMRVELLNRLPQRVTLVIGAGYPDSLAVDLVNRLSPRVALVVNASTQPDAQSVERLNHIRRPVALYIQAPSLTSPGSSQEMERLGWHVTVLEGQQYGRASINEEFMSRHRSPDGRR